MKKGMYFIIAAFALVSCEKLKDYLPNPHEQQPEFDKKYGGKYNDMFNSITTNSDDGYVMAGWTLSNDGTVSGNHGKSDGFVVKIDKTGNVVWSKALGGSAGEEIKSIVRTPEGGYILAGETSSNNGDVSGNHGGKDAWVVKLDQNGTIIWQKTLGGSLSEEINAIRLDINGGYVVAGNTYSNDGDVYGNHGGYGDAWVVKLDTDGNILWSKCFGGSGLDVANSILSNSDDSYVFTGYTESNDGDVIGNSGNGYAWIVKLNANGVIKWQKVLGGSAGSIANSIIKSSHGGYIIAGIVTNSEGDISGIHGKTDAWIVKLDENGAIQWQKALGGSELDGAFSIINSSNGGYVMAGMTDSNDGEVVGNHGDRDAWIVKLDKNGNMQWQRTLGDKGEDYALSITLGINGGYVMAGYTTLIKDTEVNWDQLFDAWVVTIKDK